MNLRIFSERKKIGMKTHYFIGDGSNLVALMMMMTVAISNNSTCIRIFRLKCSKRVIDTIFTAFLTGLNGTFHQPMILFLFRFTTVCMRVECCIH